MNRMKQEPNKAEILQLIELINNPDISSEARTTAIGMLEKQTGKQIKNKRDIFKIAEEYNGK
jgi:hypothetical protein